MTHDRQERGDNDDGGGGGGLMGFYGDGLVDESFC